MILVAAIAGAVLIGAAAAVLFIFLRTGARREQFIRFEDFFDAIPDVLGIQDRERHILGYNAAGYEYLNRQPSEVIGRKCYEMIGRHEPCEDCATQTAVETGNTTSHVRFIPETGNWFNVRAYPIRDSSGQVSRVIEHLRDITEEKRLQSQLESLNRDLESLVEKRTADLKETVEKLNRTREHLMESEKLTALGRMVAGISHEINTPLGVAYTSSTYVGDILREFIASKGTGDLMPEYSGILNELGNACHLVTENLKRAVGLMSSFKRIAADQDSEQLRRIDMKDYIGEVISSLHYLAKKTRIEVAVTGDSSGPVSTFPGAITQVITNLVTNSVQHAFEPDSGGSVVVEVVPDGNRKGVGIVYRDDGRGMKPEVLKRIYEPFFTSRIGGDGVGLGMSIVYNLVVGKLQGTIECHSAPGAGTRFDLFVPDLTEHSGGSEDSAVAAAGGD